MIANADTHTRERTAVSPTPFQSIGVPYGTAPIPPVTNPTGSPALETVLDRLERMEREAALRRLVFGNFAATIEELRTQFAGGTQGARPGDPKRIKSREPHHSGGQPHRSQERASGALEEKTDLRIYARAEPGSLLVRDQPFLIREAIVKAVPQIVAKDIPRLWATPTGWAVKPSTKAVYDLILKESNAIAICRATRCTTLERVEKWSTYRLAHVPNVLTGLLDNQLVTADIVSKEAEIQTGSKPVSCHHTQSSGPTSVWYVSFKKEVRSFTLFGSSGYSRLSVKKKSMELHNPGCQEFCNSFHCRAPSKCNNCGVATAKHQGAQGAACTAPPRCAGCYGPFPAGHKHCAAAPKKVDGKFVRPTARQLGEIRRQQLATQKACELAAKRQQERTSKDGVQVTASEDEMSSIPRQQHGPRCNHFPYPIFMLENGAERCSEDCAIIRANGLKVAWANVGRSGPAHLALLQLAFEEQADVVCIQEPSAYPGTRTQNHPAYECYAPVDAWEQVQAAEREAERPRTMSYTRKAAGLTTQQRRNGTDRDIVWLEVNGFHIVNIYREPNTRHMIDYIISLQIPPNFLIGGDFNAKHDMFEPGIHSSNQGSLLAAWSLSSGADFIGDPGEPTHRAGHTIDLTFSNIPFAETKVRHDLDSGSDHFTLVTLIPGRGQQTNANTGYRVAEDSLERFAHIINSEVPLLPRPASAQGPGDLDDVARLLTILFQNAIKAVGKKAQNAARSAPWWTPACAELHASYAKARQRSEPDQERKRRIMLSTIRNAKRDYWRRIIDNAAEDADLYKVVGWHKLSPSLKAPPLVVDGISIESTREKAEALFGKSATSIQRLGRSGLRSPRGGSAATDAPVDDGHLARRDREERQGGDAGYTGRAGRVRCAATQKAFGTDAKAGLAYGAAPANQLVPSGSQGQGPAGGHGFKVSGKQRSHARARYTPDYEMGRYEQSGLCAGEAGNDTPLAETETQAHLASQYRRSLSSAQHVSERASKALKVARHIKGLAGVKFGPPAASLRKAVITCVQSSLLYGSEIWYGGRPKPSAAAGYNRNQLVSTKLGPLIDKVNKIIILAALPSSTPAYASRSGLGLLTPPIRWTDPTEGRTKEAAAEHFNAWWSQLGRDTITVFSDGTEQYKDGAKLVGYGYAVYRGQTLARTGSGAINSISHVFDAEAIGALKGLQCALDILQPTDERIWMCIDSTSVIWCMRANASNTSQWAFLECHTLIDRYKVGIKWSPGHMGIEGNEAADELANTGANEGRTDDDRSAEPTISGIGTTAKALADIATSDWWSQCHPGLSASYRRWKLGYSVTEPPELRLPRTVLHRLLATRTAHGDFAQYHRRFGHTEAELTCLCGFEKAPDHLVFCEISQRKFHAWPARPERPPSRPEEGRRYLSALLAHPELFENFLAVTQYFAINARAQRTRDQTISGGSHMSYGSPRQNRHSLTAT
ncbi:hypothetical protein DID88_003731 [Monilinia fructigena]|uniref:RNase H type-1 domain-containing protein n=1 Tax=Monilinia fructigena TaxID=38457 RepID=A0A395IVH3_9HELO|nr:hypothetical protein DID88_003731 [Monilinia fructigena]